eukprot:RCo037720
MVNQGLLQPSGGVAQGGELGDDLVPNLIVVLNFFHFEVAFDLDREPQRGVHLADQNLQRGRVQGKGDRDVRPEDPTPEAVDVTPDVRLTLQEVVVEEFLSLCHGLVGKDDVLLERLDHQKSLAARSRALPKNLIRRHRDDRAQREDERVHVLHVQVVRRDGIGDGVARHPLGLLRGQPKHILGVDLQGVIPQLGLGNGLQAVAALGQVAVPLHPVQAVQVGPLSGHPRPLVTHRKANLLSHVDAIDGRPLGEIRHVEEVAVEGDKDVGLLELQLGKPPSQHRLLIFLIEHHKGTLVLGLWGVLEVLDVLRHNLPVDNQKPLGVHHVGDHVHGIHLGVGELQRGLRALNIEGTHPGLRVEQVPAGRGQGDLPMLHRDVEPQPHTYAQVNRSSHVVLHVVLPNRGNGVQERKAVRGIGLVWAKLPNVHRVGIYNGVSLGCFPKKVSQLAKVGDVQKEKLEQRVLPSRQVIGHVKVFLVCVHDVSHQ